jgi:hypothetical protein
MDSRRFDSLTTMFGQALTRRRALAGVASLALAGVSTKATNVAAQDASPAATPVAEGSHPVFLFVQLADSGTWEPKSGEDGTFLLTLQGTGEQTLYFSDRPERIVGTVPTDQFLDELGFTPVNPPNAAVVVTTLDGERDVLVVELLNPVYTRSFGDDGEEILTYEAIVLDTYEGTGLSEWVSAPDDDQLPREFSSVSLFIDDCPEDFMVCYSNKSMQRSQSYLGPVPNFFGAQYWDVNVQGCVPVQPWTWEELNLRCNAAYGDDCSDGPNLPNRCWAGTPNRY